ncbi:hypothetical protein LTR70_001807 [Exophiala xenobiotica]|uniref:Uncharacterized protein n=1 Tax=Lithohypha guttulata TaxID=1690604 RepID=A0ABR0KM61_9EURO|nr:hypothetical protein LTR24_000999 [Lithohypha guttulata]KAK5327065.1 hypothetical protein LTR70_001807 [Exophiala xenobiotica]
MPLFEAGDFDQSGKPIKAPPTPPHEPAYRGLALDGVVAQLEKEAAHPEVLNIQEGHNGSNGIEARDGLVRPLATTQPGTSTIGNATQSVSRHASLNKEELKLRRTSSEIAVTPGERRLSKGYVGGRVRDYAASTDSPSLVTLSPTSSVQTAESEFGPQSPQRSLFPVEEGHTSQTRSPSLTDAPRRFVQDRAIEIKRPRHLSINIVPENVVVEADSPPVRPRVPRALSTPTSIKSPNTATRQDQRKSRTYSRTDQTKPRNLSSSRHSLPSPLPASIPMPPLSLSTYLQLELSSQRPSQIYIHRSSTNDFPYESSRVKVERLLNFLFLPHQLEGVLWFGVLACLDVWLYTFTILPLRMIKSISILSQSFATNLAEEARFVMSFILVGSRRVWHRRRTRGQSAADVLSRTSSGTQTPQTNGNRPKTRTGRHHRRTKSTPSNLMPDDKADILKGFLIIATCFILLKLDASRMYHWVRGQAAIKLYVIYNLLEVCDRLLSALGQDVLECLFSQEALERKPDGHSKVLRPLWLFVLALVYSVVHATALFYQVVTLNVAVNSYSNALVTLLMSNQFVEIKGTVFKKFERENLFQLTCADIVERFQLWHMLMIIASRNIVETGGFPTGIPTLLSPAATTTSSSSPNITHAAPPLSAASIFPQSFMIVPSMLSSVSSYVPAVAHVLGPFVIVLGSEMLIDWLKHAYIGKFNNTKPVIYGRFLDILAKDYYTSAFGEQNLTKRLGLPIIPLSCLMIRAGFQTYQMFVASWMPARSSSNAATLASIHQQYSTTRAQPTSTAAMIVRKMDDILNQLPAVLSDSHVTSYMTTILVLLLMFLVLLVCKLILGMGLLAFSRARYRSMKERERTGNPSPYIDGGRRVGGWGVVEVDDDKRRIIYEDDPAALQALKAKEAKDKARKEQEKERGYTADGLEKIKRYEMAAKRIW